MAALTREQLWNQLKSGEILPVYVLFGVETQLRDKAVKAIADMCFGEGDLRDFNEDEFSLNSEENLQRAFAAANQLPMMASRRVIRVMDVRVTAGGKNDTVKEEHEPILRAYLENPSPTSTVIFVADDLNGVKKMAKLLRAQAGAVEFSILDDEELAKVARRGFSDNGIKIDESALRYLVSIVGPNVRRLTTEVEKLSAAAMPEAVVNADLIEALVPNTREVTNFALTDQIVRKNKARALSVLHKILDDGAEPVMLLGLISYNFRRLLMVADMMSRGMDRREVARVMNLRYSDQEDFLKAARQIGAHKLAHALKRIAETDIALKSSLGGGGPAGSRMQIEMLVCELAAI